MTFTCIGWWGDVIKESRAGDHTPVVDIGLRYGMILFIASEVMFFVAWFWMFFELAIFHEHRADWIVPTWDPETAAAWANWPPPHVETFDPFHLPLMNTLILLLSGTTVTWAHHALQQSDRKGATLGLLLTVLLGCVFTYIQFGVEYPEAGFAFGNQGDVTTCQRLWRVLLHGDGLPRRPRHHRHHLPGGVPVAADCRADSPPPSISASKRRPGIGTSSTWCGCSCSPSST